MTVSVNKQISGKPNILTSKCGYPLVNFKQMWYYGWVLQSIACFFKENAYNTVIFLEYCKNSLGYWTYNIYYIQVATNCFNSIAGIDTKNWWNLDKLLVFVKLGSILITWLIGARITVGSTWLGLVFGVIIQSLLELGY